MTGPSTTRKRPFRKNIAAVGDTVIVAFGKNDTQLVKLSKLGVTQNKFGALRHEDVVGKPYGSRVCNLCIYASTNQFNWLLRFAVLNICNVICLKNDLVDRSRIIKLKSA